MTIVGTHDIVAGRVDHFGRLVYEYLVGVIDPHRLGLIGAQASSLFGNTLQIVVESAQCLVSKRPHLLPQ